MAWFKGRNKAEGAATEDTDEDVEVDPAEAADAALAAAETVRTDEERRREELRAQQGPLDDSEAEEAEVGIDLGALRLPARRDVELRLEVQDSTRVVSVTVATAGSALQLQAFAAPRTSGIWDDIRGEIAAQVSRQGGSAEEVSGVFGPELVARVPVRTADGRTGHQPSRFVGIDGPRWFLRGVFSGAASHDPAAAAPLEELLRSCVVVRGPEARPPRELLPLKLPPTAQPRPAPGTAPAAAAGAAPGTATGTSTEGRQTPAEPPASTESVEAADGD